MNKVAIMMATYNGEKYVKEQIDSILNQTYKWFHLYIRDDNSTDSTPEILDEYQKKYDNITVIKDDNNNHGACNNFLNIIKYINSNKIEYDYYMFSDQDDYWINTKVEDSVNEIKKYNQDLPILVHTDLYVVNSKLDILDNSFLSYRSLNPSIVGFNRLLIQNNVTGCTIIMNKALFKLVPYNQCEKIVMHDWWIALIASVFGEIHFLNKSTIKYRQHGNNVVGATKVKSIGFIIQRLLKKNFIKDSLKKSIIQAKEFKIMYYDKMNNYNKKELDKFISLEKKNKIKKIFLIIKYNFTKQGLIQKIGEFLFI